MFELAGEEFNVLSPKQLQPILYEKLKVHEALGKKRISRITRAEIVEACERALERGSGAMADCNRKRAVQMFDFAIGRDYVTANPARHIKKYNTLDERKNERRCLTTTELRKIGIALTKLRADLPQLEWAWCAIFIMLHSGERKSEVLHLRWSDVDRLGRKYKGKTAGQRRRYSTAILMRLEERRQHADPSSPLVFPSKQDPMRPMRDMRYALAHLVKLAGIDPIDSHTFRHTFASYAAYALGDAHQAGTLLNHKSISTTEKYLHEIDELNQKNADKMDALMSKMLETPLD